MYAQDFKNETCQTNVSIQKHSGGIEQKVRLVPAAIKESCFKFFGHIIRHAMDGGKYDNSKINTRKKKQIYTYIRGLAVLSVRQLIETAHDGDKW